MIIGVQPDQYKYIIIISFSRTTYTHTHMYMHLCSAVASVKYEYIQLQHTALSYNLNSVDFPLCLHVQVVLVGVPSLYPSHPIGIDYQE